MNTFAVVAGLLSLLVLILTAWLLHQFERSKRKKEPRPWWKTWVRSAMVAAVAFILAGISVKDLDRYINAASLWSLSACMIPIVYRRIGIGFRSFELEQLSVWCAWGFGGWLINGNALHIAPLTIVCWAAAALLGGLIVRREIREMKRESVRSALLDTALGAWAAFLPWVMTFTLLAEEHYAKAVGCAMTLLVIAATAVGLIMTGSSRDRGALVAIGAVWPASMGVAAISGDFTTVLVYCAWTFVALGVGLLIKRAADAKEVPIESHSVSV